MKAVITSYANKDGPYQPAPMIRLENSKCLTRTAGMHRSGRSGFSVSPYGEWTHFHGIQLLFSITSIIISGSIFRNLVVHFFIEIEMEGLECVKDEVAHVLIHVCVQYPTIKVINGSTSVHYLNGRI